MSDNTPKKADKIANAAFILGLAGIGNFSVFLLSFSLPERMRVVFADVCFNLIFYIAAASTLAFIVGLIMRAKPVWKLIVGAVPAIFAGLILGFAMIVYPAF